MSGAGVLARTAEIISKTLAVAADRRHLIVLKHLTCRAAGDAEEDKVDVGYRWRTDFRYDSWRDGLGPTPNLRRQGQRQCQERLVLWRTMPCQWPTPAADRCNCPISAITANEKLFWLPLSDIARRWSAPSLNTIACRCASHTGH
jgi:hypothetical protein